MLAFRKASSKALQRRRCFESATSSLRGTSTLASSLLGNRKKEGKEKGDHSVDEENHLLHQASRRASDSFGAAYNQRSHQILDGKKSDAVAPLESSVSFAFQSMLNGSAAVSSSSSFGYQGYSLSNSIIQQMVSESRGLGRRNVLLCAAAGEKSSGWNRRVPYQQQFAYFSTEPALNSNDDDKETKSEKVTSYSGTRTTNRPIPSRKLGPTPVPTPPSAPPEVNPLERLKETTPKSVIRKGVDLTISLFKTIVTFLLKLPGNLLFYATHPKETREAWHRLRDAAKEEANHYWVGTKLLWAEIRTARKLLGKTLEGNSLTRRERKQLLRTVSDLFRLIPFSMFVLIPFMEFALPIALRIFPNMLPSTYQDSLKAEENMKRELKSRIAMAQFFQETMEELAKEQKRKASKKKKELEEAGVDLAKEDDITIEAQQETAASMLQFLEKARNGEMVPPDVIIRYANYFKDDLTLDNMPRMQLINMCRYMGIQPYGSDAFLRFQLRHRIRVLKEDDQRILWEGIDSLTKMELREACQERGMRSTGLSKDAYRRALQQWLDLSVNKDVPISLLIMSRSFFLQEEAFEKEPDDRSKSLSGLADAISGLDKEILNEVILEVATQEEKLSDPDVRKIRLAVVSQQNELIRQEEEAREAAAKKKEAAEKEKAEKEAAEEAPKPIASPASPTEAISAAATEKLVSPATSSFDTEKPVESHEAEVKEEHKAKEESNLSAEEMDAISQLVLDDPVSKERQELARIKAAMNGEKESVAEIASAEIASPAEATSRLEPKKEEVEKRVPESSVEPISADDADRLAKETIKKMDRQAAAEADAATKVSLDVHKEVKPDTKSEAPESSKAKDEAAEDPIVARLKKRIKSMVDKIEVQLSETQVKIGDKLHHLDKDRDGILTREEMADALQQVLKRKISFEEAMEIANEMDENHDGVFTVQELIRWIDEHKLVTFVAEGRDADMDRVMESQSSNQQKEEAPETVEKKD